MRNRIRKWATPIATLGIFFALLGIIGRMELDAMTERDCGMVMDSDSVGMVPASCATESELESRMDAIRLERSGFRTWEDGR